ncbi:MAG: hypothetical protein H7Z71_07735 [Moraxellaceae bacterium]|nr:hypothetical protein [Pseudobdellovibrionaceae bacterium]
MWIRHLVGIGAGLVISFSASADVFPTAPLKTLTPGATCQKADSYRYPEHIAYCERNVDAIMKWEVISLYTKNIPGFSITPSNRGSYKIDHYIPLCMGGANVVSNLWPQHGQVYAYTDSVEADLCKELSLGKITQAVAIARMKFAKSHVQELKKLDPAGRMKYVSENYNK